MRLRQVGRSWVVHTPAKLNLFLEVLGKRADGFHELETLMVTVNLFDTLVLTEEPSTEVSLRCRDVCSRFSSDSQDVPEGRDNLAVRAAELLRSETGADFGIHIDLIKRIPSAAGLAGGSSDAAATLFALNQVRNLGLSRDELQNLASVIGSDVSFFLSPSPTAICQGRGESIRPIQSPVRLHFVIAKPASGLSTAQVFNHCRPVENPQGAEALVESLQRGDLMSAGRQMVNSLQPAAESLNPDMKRLRDRFSRLPFVGHMMSGSGTTWFGVCRHRCEARMAAARLRASGPDRVFVAESPP